MNIENIDEVQILIQEYRHVMGLKNQILTAGASANVEFYRLVSQYGEDIEPAWLMPDIFEAIEGVLNDQYDDITKRLREFD